MASAMAVSPMVQTTNWDKESADKDFHFQQHSVNDARRDSLQPIDDIYFPGLDFLNEIAGLGIVPTAAQRSSSSLPVNTSQHATLNAPARHPEIRRRRVTVSDKEPVPKNLNLHSSKVSFQIPRSNSSQTQTIETSPEKPPVPPPKTFDDPPPPPPKTQLAEPLLPPPKAPPKEISLERRPSPLPKTPLPSSQKEIQPPTIPFQSSDQSFVKKLPPLPPKGQLPTPGMGSGISKSKRIKKSLKESTSDGTAGSVHEHTSETLSHGSVDPVKQHEDGSHAASGDPKRPGGVTSSDSEENSESALLPPVRHGNGYGEPPSINTPIAVADILDDFTGPTITSSNTITAGLDSQATMNAESQLTVPKTPGPVSQSPTSVCSSSHVATDSRRPVLSLPYSVPAELQIPALKPIHYNCVHYHRNMRKSSNAYYPVGCMACKSDRSDGRWCCSWCSLRVCGRCFVRLQTLNNRSLQELMEGIET